jgi:signal transduction histidine kinase
LARLAILAVLGWTAAVGASLSWTLALHRQEIVDMARSEARAAFDTDLAYRGWNARLGGVYAPADSIRPNPWLAVEHRDLETEAGLLTLVNPAYMTRIVHELSADRTGLIGHITSLRPLRPGNAPDDWERGALETFEGGSSEVAEVRTIDGAEYLRFMRPLHVEEPCLACHGDDGYRLGQVRGGISVSVPLAPIADITSRAVFLTVAGHLVFWAVGLAGIAVAARTQSRLLGRLQEAFRGTVAARNEAFQANRAKSQFLAAMSHELRTPLNAILGFAEMIRDGIGGRASAETHAEYAEYIHASGRHLLDLIDDILDISKIEAGRLEPNPEPLDARQLIRDCADLLHAAADERGLSVEVVVPEDLVVFADRRAFKQIVVNLLSNAVKYTPPGGAVAVRAASAPDGHALLTVSDTGPGIPETEIDRLMRPFERLENGYRRPENGSGLGLALVRGLVDLHGGRMDMDSAPGRGTRVTVRLPPPPTA